MQPLDISISRSSTRLSSAPPLRTSWASTLTSLMSLTMTATRRPSRLCSAWLSNVVLPAPRKPESTVTGRRESFNSISPRAQDAVGRRLRRRACAKPGKRLRRQSLGRPFPLAQDGATILQTATRERPLLVVCDAPNGGDGQVNRYAGRRRRLCSRDRCTAWVGWAVSASSASTCGRGTQCYNIASWFARDRHPGRPDIDERPGTWIVQLSSTEPLPHRTPRRKRGVGRAAPRRRPPFAH